MHGMQDIPAVRVAIVVEFYPEVVIGCASVVQLKGTGLATLPGRVAAFYMQLSAPRRSASHRTVPLVVVGGGNSGNTAAWAVGTTLGVHQTLP